MRLLVPVSRPDSTLSEQEIHSPTLTASLDLAGIVAAPFAAALLSGALCYFMFAANVAMLVTCCSGFVIDICCNLSDAYCLLMLGLLLLHFLLPYCQVSFVLTAS